ncbi:MAG UNVERIFIED_CONTAM: ATP-binding protein [Anaerolineae bacterium]|jgi:signal transduction histidine kinase
MTIRTKLILWYAGLLAFLIVVFGLIVFLFIQWTLITAIDEMLQATTTQVLDNSRAVPIGEMNNPDSIRVILPSLDIFTVSGVFVQVWDVSASEPVFVATSANIRELTRPLDAEAIGGAMVEVNNVLYGARELRVLTSPIILPNGALFGSIQVAASLNALNQATERLLTILLVNMGVAVVGAVIVGLLLANRALEPIDRLIDAAARITETEDLTTRLSWRGPMDELGRLTSVFNLMMDRLEHLFGVQQRFVADVSHELRTPLTAVRGNLELMQRYGTDEESMQAIRDEVARMTRMVDDLLLLARADYGGLKVDLDVLDLDSIVLVAYREARAIIHANDRDLTLTMGHFEPARISGNADRIKQLLLNLLGNAIKFTPDGGTITLSLSNEGQYAVMRVQDTGIGIEEQSLPQIFERFFQEERSRFRAGAESGAAWDWQFAVGLWTFTKGKLR